MSSPEYKCTNDNLRDQVQQAIFELEDSINESFERLLKLRGDISILTEFKKRCEEDGSDEWKVSFQEALNEAMKENAEMTLNHTLWGVELKAYQQEFDTINQENRI